MRWAWPVSLGLTVRQVTGSGKVERDGFIEAATRAAVLVDLTFAGRIEDTGADVVVDASRTGFPPADVLLEAMEAQADWLVDWWIGSGPPVQPLLVGELVKAGALVVRPRSILRPWRRYAVSPGHSGDAILRGAPVGSDPIETEQIAALDALAAIASGSLYVERPIGACGRVAWLVQAADDLVAVGRLREAESRAAWTGSG